MPDQRCRWGILGTANIANKNWQGINNALNASLVAVASRSVERAREFIDRCQAQVPFGEPPEAVGSYDALISHPSVDAIYIPLPTGLRREWVLRAAAEGKHVLVEKPCGINAEVVAEMIEACKAKQVQFMDGVMFSHSDRLKQLQESIDRDDAIGEVKRITSQFSFRAPDEFLKNNIRMSAELEPLGCLGDLGWYNIRFVLHLLKGALPSKVSGRLLNAMGRPDSSDPVPVEFSGELFYSDGPSASFYCSFLAENQQWANVCGTKGYIHLRDFVLPFYGGEIDFDIFQSEFDVDGCHFNMKPGTRTVTVGEYSNNAPGAQESKLFTTFSKCVLEGKPDYEHAEMALATQRVMDACLNSAKREGSVVSID